MSEARRKRGGSRLRKSDWRKKLKNGERRQVLGPISNPAYDSAVV